jgi:primosomal protein N' (replication factor Y)
LSEPEYFDHGALVAVMTTQPLGRALDYKAPEGGCHLGAFVEVPLGPRKVLGVVWGAGQGDYALNKIRHVIRVLDAAPMRPRGHRGWVIRPRCAKCTGAVPQSQAN